MAKRKKPGEDGPNENSDNINESDDTFGLPEIEYEPLKREEESESSQPEDSSQEETSQPIEEQPADSYSEESTYQEEPSDYNYTFKQEESSPVWPKALLIVALIVIVVGGGLYYFLKYKPEKDEADRIAQKELAEKKAKQRRELAVRDSLARIEADRNQRINDSIAQASARPAVGTIETLSERTRKYYVVIASAIDDDLIMDHANLLSAKGVSTKIIPPFGKAQFFRLTIDEGDTYADAQAKADGLKGEYGDGLWVIRY